MARRRSMRAFTLIEVLVVLAVVGVIAAIALPSVSSMLEGRASRVEVGKVTDVFKEARDTARDKRRCVRVSRFSANVVLVEVLPIVALSGACDLVAPPQSSKAIPFNAKFVSIPASLVPVVFDRVGAVNGVTTDFVDVTIDSQSQGVTIPHVMRIYRLLGLVRQVS